MCGSLETPGGILTGSPWTGEGARTGIDDAAVQIIKLSYAVLLSTYYVPPTVPGYHGSKVDTIDGDKVEDISIVR